MKNYSNPYEAPTIEKDGEKFEDLKKNVSDGFLGLIATNDGWYDSNGNKLGGTGSGEDGKSAYEIACENGFDGSEEDWLDSLEGKDGKPYAYMLTVGEDGTLYCEYADTDTPPNFVYDEETGYVYYVTENSTRYEVLDVNIIVEKVLGQLPEGGATTFRLMSIDNEIGTKDLVITDESGQTILNMSFVRDNTDTATIMTVSNIDGQSVDITIRDGKDGVDGQNGVDGKDGKDGKDGQDYVLTATDKNEIAELVKTLIPLSDYVKTTDIIDNLTTNISDKPLSASQGIVLKGLIDAIEIPTDYVKTVNGITPNEIGDVSIPLDEYAKTEDIPTDYIKTVNDIPPDEHGNVVVTVTTNPPEPVLSIDDMEYDPDNPGKQYVMDGYIYAYMKHTEIVPAHDEPNFTNQIPISIDDSGAIFNGIGYMNDARLSSGGSTLYTLSGGDADSKDRAITGFIPCKKGDIIRLNKYAYYQIMGLGLVTGLFSTNGGSSLANITPKTVLDGTTPDSYINIVAESNNLIVSTYKQLDSFTINNDSAKYIRLGFTSHIDERAVVTVNEEITYTHVPEKVREWHEWTNTNQTYNKTDYSKEVTELQENAKALEARLKIVEENELTGVSVPNYVVTEAESVIERVKSKENPNTLTLAFATDIHMVDSDAHKKILNNIVGATDMIAGCTGLSFFITGGDNLESTSTTTKEGVLRAAQATKDKLKKLSVPYFTANGNHDNNSVGSKNKDGTTYNAYTVYNGTEYNILDEELYMSMCKQCERFGEIHYDYENMGKLYCYVDFPVQKIRLFILNGVDIPIITTDDGNGNLKMTYHGQQDFGFRNEQLNFVANNLHNLDNDWAAMFVCHFVPFPIDLKNLDGTDATFDDHGVGYTPYNGDVLWNIIKAYKNGEKYTSQADVVKTYLTTNVSTTKSSSDFAYSVDVDFTGKNGEVIGVLTGHRHLIKAWEKDGVFITCTSAATQSNGGLGDDNTIDEWKTTNTAKETAFDIVTIDRKAGKMYYTGYGANKDREITYKGV